MIRFQLLYFSGLNPPTIEFLISRPQALEAEKVRTSDVDMPVQRRLLWWTAVAVGLAAAATVGSCTANGGEAAEETSWADRCAGVKAITQEEFDVATFDRSARPSSLHCYTLYFTPLLVFANT